MGLAQQGARIGHIPERRAGREIDVGATRGLDEDSRRRHFDAPFSIGNRWTGRQSVEPSIRRGLAAGFEQAGDGFLVAERAFRARLVEPDRPTLGIGEEGAIGQRRRAIRYLLEDDGADQESDEEQPGQEGAPGKGATSG